MGLIGHAYTGEQVKGPGLRGSGGGLNNDRGGKRLFSKPLGRQTDSGKNGKQQGQGSKTI
jgi:hypothetical protein